jgi:hypothetical protein
VFRARIFELLRSPRIDSKEPIQVTHGPVRQSYSYSVPSPHILFKNSSTGVMKPVLTLCCGRVLATLSRYHWKLLHFSLFLMPYCSHSFSSIMYRKITEKSNTRQKLFLKPSDKDQPLFKYEHLHWNTSSEKNGFEGRCDFCLAGTGYAVSSNLKFKSPNFICQ